MLERATAWRNIPTELQALSQWCVAGANKAPMSINLSGSLFSVSVTRPSEWMSFDKAAKLAWDNQRLFTKHVLKSGKIIEQVGLDIGFILHENDPFTCIDLDVKDIESHPNEPQFWTTTEQWDRYGSIVREFDSYTERSRGGKGFHIWVKGKIGLGYRRDGVEVYSQERFIICTGNVLMQRELQDNSLLLANLISRMMPAPSEFQLQEFPEKEDDWAILETAFNAVNSDKFIPLWRGEWELLGFPSQSEADMALMSMLTFYSKSNIQVRRMFRESGLGKREKATKDDRYINLTLTTIRHREANEQRADISIMLSSALAIAEATKTAKQRTASEIQRLTGVTVAPQGFTARAVAPLHVAGTMVQPQAPAPEPVQMAALAPVTKSMIDAGSIGIPWPPGFLGHVAKYIYQSANRQVKEVAIVAALGLMAGLAGKAWHIPKSGLNLYIILVARSAIGKETMHNGISEIVSACNKENPLFGKYVDFKDYASGPALIKACVANPCFVNVSGEWGRKLKRLAQDDGRDGPLQTLRTQMTNLYQKSGPQSIVGGIGYSAVDNNVASIAGVSYSMIGETTPGTFYDSLTESMMEDGFLSRFLIMEYDGLRPEANELSLSVPDDHLKKALNAIAQQADNMISKTYSQLINRTDEAAFIMQEFEKECDVRINGTQDESRRQMWNRAALKSLRVAGLLAVADNWITPMITEEHIQWAQIVVRNDIALMSKRLDSGDVGASDKSRERKLTTLLKAYLPTPLAASYDIPDEMRKNGIIPRNYLLIRVSRVSAFYNHKHGTVKALDDALNSMVNSGYLMEVSKDKMSQQYNFHGRAFRIISLPNHELADTSE